jgi:hypothetical protein
MIPSAYAGIQLYLWEKMPNVLAGVDLAREEAYRTMLARRFPREDPGCHDAPAKRARI